MKIDAHFVEHLAVVEAARARLVPKLAAAASLMVEALRRGGTILVCGNGGSAADAQHFVAELIGRFERERAGLRALALTTDSSILTAVANDYGYERVFARQIEALARKGDIVVAISTSGNSANVLAAAQAANERQARVIGLTGGGGGRLAELAELTIDVDAKSVARIQEVHELCLHALADAIETELATTPEAAP